MEIDKIQKLGGICLMLGGILLAVYVFLYNMLLPVDFIESDFSRLVLSPHWVQVLSLALFAVILLVFGFTAAYSKIYTFSGIVGLAGYIVLMIGYEFQIGQLVLEVFFYPIIASTDGGIELFRQDALIHHTMAQWFYMLFVVSIGLGVLLFGITAIRSKVYSIWSGLLFILGAVLYVLALTFVLKMAGIMLFATGCSLIGLRLQRD